MGYTLCLTLRRKPAQECIQCHAPSKRLYAGLMREIFHVESQIGIKTTLKQAVMTLFNMYIFSSVILALKLQEKCWQVSKPHHMAAPFLRETAHSEVLTKDLQRLANPW